MINLDYSADFELLLHNGRRQEYACNSEDNLGVPLSTQYSHILWYELIENYNNPMEIEPLMA